MTKPDIIAGVNRIPHDAIDSFIERATALVDAEDERDGVQLTTTGAIAYLDDAITNLRQLRAEWEEKNTEVEQIRAFVAASEACVEAVRIADLEDRYERFRAACADMLAKMREGLEFNLSNCPWCDVAWPHPVDATHETIRAEYERHDNNCASNPMRQRLTTVERERDDLRDALFEIRTYALNAREMSPSQRCSIATMADDALNPTMMKEPSNVAE